ncbi:transcription factor BIM2-like isoform X2 [Tasmannia lanceolata]|uniref:transcription factor BIM2-like isoform X2 n=1 Tax=Tasmannia lanceolata TaxID=3420 RepID=UPI0040640BAE
MELPQPRPFGNEGKKPTHDFLSLYSDSSFQHQDPRPSSQGFYLKTHDFLQPLERSGKSNAIGEATNETSNVEKPSSVEHILPGGIGTYSINHISSFSQGIVKPEISVCTPVRASSIERKVEASKSNSNSNSYSGGLLTLWEESAAKEKGIVKDKVGERQLTREPTEKLGQWSSFSESPFPPFVPGTRSLSSLLSSKLKLAQKSQGFMQMMKSMKGLPEEEDDDDEEYVKKEGSSHRGDLGVQVDGKGDQRAVTPRSKHSATEQRRRSKINDRFQILRELIPHSDQKRDKASFLLEVIEYIQFLQERVYKYEAAFPGWNQDSIKLMPWKHSQGPGESTTDHSRPMKNGPVPGLIFAGKFEDNNIAISPTMLANMQTPIESEMSTGAPYKAMDHLPSMASKVASNPLQQNTYPCSIGRSTGPAQSSQRLISDAENMACQPQPQLWQRPCPADSDMLTEQEELTIEGGTIRMSNVYSQGLLSSLTHALHSSGIDLSQASISVQIDLGKRAITSRPSTTTSSAKDHEDPSSSNRAMGHSRVASSGEDSDHAQKRFKMDNS